MLIYAAADIHGHPRRFRRLISQTAAHRPDMLVLAGDICSRRHSEVILDGLNRLALPVLLIHYDGRSSPLCRMLSPDQ